MGERQGERKQGVVTVPCSLLFSILVIWGTCAWCVFQAAGAWIWAIAGCVGSGSWTWDWGSMSFFFMALYYSVVWIYYILVIHLSVDWHFELFPLFGYSQYSCCEHQYASFCVGMFLVPLGIYLVISSTMLRISYFSSSSNNTTSLTINNSDIKEILVRNVSRHVCLDSCLSWIKIIFFHTHSFKNYF